ncbi:MAG: hypothetical protein M1816_003582 [Peltula sp. TS41687]|nr:MAG: hypothetical protein M1816_003582 [Peltula sp. TS41687]
MKLVLYLIPVSTVISLSIGVCIEALRHQRDHGSVESNGRMQWSALNSSPSMKGTTLRKVVKRGEHDDDPDTPPDGLLEEDHEHQNHRQRTSGDNAAEKVLSPEEFETYLDLKKAHNAYHKALYKVKTALQKRLKPPAEAVEAMDANRTKVAAYAKMRKLIQKRIFESSNAQSTAGRRAKDRDRFHKEMRSRHNRDFYAGQKKWIAALEARVKSPQATEQDRQDWRELEAKRKVKARADLARYHAKRAKVNEANARIKAEQGTEEDYRVTRAWDVTRQARTEASKKWQAKQKSKKATQESSSERADATSEDVSDAWSDTTEDGRPSQGVDTFNQKPPQSPASALLSKAGHLIENIGDRWRAIPGNQARPTYLPPVLPEIPLKVIL